jgi:hypothetical protein
MKMESGITRRQSGEISTLNRCSTGSQPTQSPVLRFGMNLSKFLQVLWLVAVGAAVPSLSAQAAPASTQSTILNSIASLNGSVTAPSTTATDSNAEAMLILQQPPFVPTDINLLLPQIYGGAAAVQPPDTGVEPSLTEMQAKLKTTFAARFGKGTVKYFAAMTAANWLLKAALMIQYVPDIRLRAAVASQIGTVGSGIIPTIINGTYHQVEYFNGAGLENGGARVMNDDQGNLVLRMSPVYKNEAIDLQGITLSHEMNHQDYDNAGDLRTSTVNSAREELIATEVAALNYAKLLLEQPNLATVNTQLAQLHNTDLMALLNTRLTDGRVNLFESMGPIFPNSLKDTPYAAYGFEQLFNANPAVSSTPGNAAMWIALSRITGQNMIGANFDDATVQTLSETLFNYLQPTQWVKVANTLKLNTNP